MNNAVINITDATADHQDNGKKGYPVQAYLH